MHLRVRPFLPSLALLASGVACGQPSGAASGSDASSADATARGDAALSLDARSHSSVFIDLDSAARPGTGRVDGGPDSRADIAPDASPDASPRMFIPPTDMRDRIGIYAWGYDTSAWPGTPDRLNWAVNEATALGARMVRVYLGPEDIYDVLASDAGTLDLTAVASSPAYATLNLERERRHLPPDHLLGRRRDGQLERRLRQGRGHGRAERDREARRVPPGDVPEQDVYSPQLGGGQRARVVRREHDGLGRLRGVDRGPRRRGERRARGGRTEREAVLGTRVKRPPQRLDRRRARRGSEPMCREQGPARGARRLLLVLVLGLALARPGAVGRRDAARVGSLDGSRLGKDGRPVRDGRPVPRRRVRECAARYRSAAVIGAIASWAPPRAATGRSSTTSRPASPTTSSPASVSTRRAAPPASPRTSSRRSTRHSPDRARRAELPRDQPGGRRQCDHVARDGRRRGDGPVDLLRSRLHRHGRRRAREGGDRGLGRRGRVDVVLRERGAGELPAPRRRAGPERARLSDRRRRHRLERTDHFNLAVSASIAESCGVVARVTISSEDRSMLLPLEAGRRGSMRERCGP